MSGKSVIVIGAGIGGIAAAAHLAQQGFHVTVLETTPNPGGRCDFIIRDGHFFDVGPTLFMMPLVYEAEFKSLGYDLHEILDLQRVDPTYKLVFDDGSHLNLTSDLQKMHAQLEAVEPGSFQGLLRYLVEGERHYRIGMARLVNRDFRKASQFFKLSNIPLLVSVNPLVKHYAHMSKYFHSSRLKSAFTFQDVYMGLSPFQAPATFSMMSFTEIAHGDWYPQGGMFQVVKALMTIAQQAGVEFEFNADVERIEVQGNSARRVTLSDGRSLTADVFLANADLPYVYQKLLPDKDLADKLLHKRYSCSTISFFWGIDKPVDGLGPHTLFLADDYQDNFTSIIRDLDLPKNPSLYIHAPARLDPSKAPPGQDTLIAIVPVGHLAENGQQDWEAISDRARNAVFSRLAVMGITGLEQHIKFETSLSPLSWQKRYNLVKGATHGLSHNLLQLGYLRPHNRHPRYHNLYFVGASTHPGTGVPTALISARLAARRIIEER